MTEIGYLGPSYSYSHQIARKIFKGKKLTLIPKGDINQIVKSVLRGKLKKGIVPFWNSYDNSLRAFQEQIWKEPVIVKGVAVLPIKLCLMSNASSLSNVKRIYSNEHVFSQCSQWRKDNLADSVKTVSVASTSKAAEKAKKQKYGAAVGAKEAGAKACLNILAENIQGPKDYTLFFIIERDRKDKSQIDGTFSLFCMKLKDIKGINVICKTVEEERKGFQKWFWPQRIGRNFLFFFEIKGRKYDLDVVPLLHKIGIRLSSDPPKLIGSYNESITAICKELFA